MTANRHNVVSEDVLERLHKVADELEQAFIIMRFKFSTPYGQYNNEINDIPYVGNITVHSGRDPIFINEVQLRIKDLRKLLNRAPDYITRGRAAAIRQRYFVLRHKNSNASKAYKHWNEKSAKYLAGRFLLGTFDKYFKWDELR